MSSGWSAPADVAAKVRRRWDDGSLLRAYARREPAPVIEVPLRGPKVSQIGDDLDAVRAWVAALDAGRRDDARYALRWSDVGGRSFGRNRLPTRAVVDSFDQAWALLGVAATVRELDEILALVEGVEPVRAWVAANPLKAVRLRAEWPRLLRAYAWLDRERGSGRYLREISAPGVDTKFAEQHRATLAALLGVGASASGFRDGLGLAGKPEIVRLRVSPGLGLPAALSEVAVRADELRELDLRPASCLVVENETTYLSVDVPDRGIVLWGKGFEVDRVGRLPWLREVATTYWGDVDTHGFAILDRLRAWLPQTRSVLMDRDTLLAHRDRWGSEDRPARSRLTRLDPVEADLYEDLVTDRLGERVRLEQERIDWGWVVERLRR